MTSPISIIAPAKVNLFLHVTGKRVDGYHLLDSVVAFTEFGDVLEIADSDQLKLDVIGPFAKALTPGDNLVLKAAKLLREHAGVSKGAHIVLTKNIPVGAGLGGGSSDAAATLLGLVRLWNITLSQKFLEILAINLGSDVPVCLTRQMALLRGAGDEISKIDYDNKDWKNCWLVLANPAVPLLTADVYRKFSGTFTKKCNLPPSMSSLYEWLGFIHDMHNDLEPPARTLLPEIGLVVMALAVTPGCQLARMSGSGSTCFGIYKDETAARHACIDIKRKYPRWWVEATPWYDKDAHHG